MSAHKIFRGGREDAPGAGRVLPYHEVSRGIRPDKTDLRGVYPATKFPVEALKIHLLYDECVRSQHFPWTS